MAMIHRISKDQAEELLEFTIDKPGFDFIEAKMLAKEKALEKCDYPMILSWKNGKTGESYPNYECGAPGRPFWIRYAESRGANLTIDFNDGEYVFMILKM